MTGIIRVLTKNPMTQAFSQTSKFRTVFTLGTVNRLFEFVSNFNAIRILIAICAICRCGRIGLSLGFGLFLGFVVRFGRVLGRFDFFERFPSRHDRLRRPGSTVDLVGTVRPDASVGDAYGDRYSSDDRHGLFPPCLVLLRFLVQAPLQFDEKRFDFVVDLRQF